MRDFSTWDAAAPSRLSGLPRSWHSPGPNPRDLVAFSKSQGYRREELIAMIEQLSYFHRKPTIDAQGWTSVPPRAGVRG